MVRKKKQPFKAETPQKDSKEETLIKKAADEEKSQAKKNVNKKPLTDRQKFHKFYREEYMKDIDLDAPHHPDKHGILGYENNVVKKEVWSRQEGGYVEQEVNGFCEYCSLSQKSAKEAYAS
jgi:hypothetical protein